MKLTIRQYGLAILVMGGFCASDLRLEAQETNSPLMAGLERPFSQPIFETLGGEPATHLNPSDSYGQGIVQQSHALHSDSSMRSAGYVVSGSTPSQCTDSGVSSQCCVEEKPWWKRHCFKMNRKMYFNYHSSHPKALHPIVHPACQPGYGYYETCWRKISPNPCFCAPDHLPTFEQDQMLPQGLTYPQALEGEPLPPAPAYDK